MTVLIVLWYLIGACGCFVGWLAEMRFNAYLGKKYRQRSDKMEWYPTPRAIFFGSIFSILGPVAVIGGCMMYAIVWVDYLSEPGPVRKWLTKPICK